MANLHIIDFSDGIRSEEIQDNFEMLNDEISRERLSIGGSGIASGLEITPLVSDTQFAIKVSAATIVDKNGDEIYIEEQIINVDRPELSEQLEYLTANVNNQVVLKEVPYMANGVCPVQYGDSLSPLYSGINVSYQNSSSTDDYIRVRAVNGKVLSLSGLTRRNVAIKYKSTAKRIDTVYVDTNNKIKVASSSITSTTPSAVIPEKYNYLIAFIQIEPEYMKDENDTPHAYITIKKDLRTQRNLYTDSNGTLYVCGTAFTDLHLITTEEPLEPQPNQLWLDGDTLYVWKAVDDYTYKHTIEVASDRNFDGFNDFKTAIDYMIGAGQLKIYINGNEVQSTAYDEMFGEYPASIQVIPDNTYSNKFRLYTSISAGDKITYTIKFTESGYKWVPINKEAYANTRECKVFGVDSSWEGGNYWTSPYADALGRKEYDDENGEAHDYKFQYFIFNAESDRPLFFTPGYNEVEVMVNQVPLHRDQFVELTLEIIPSLPIDLQNIIADTFGWSESRISTMNALYDDIGIGVMLVEPLDYVFQEGQFNLNNQLIAETELYVEITVNRACSIVNSKRKLQRSAVYIYEDTFKVTDTFNKTITLDDAYYRYYENQLEVYLNGVKLIRDVDFEEGTDLEKPVDENGNELTIDEYYSAELSGRLRMRGEVSRQFSILKAVHVGDVINYRITTNFFSYDHINSLVDELETEQEACSAKVETLYNTTLEFCQNTEAVVGDMKKEIARLTGDSVNSLDSYLTTSSVIGQDQIDPDLVQRIPQSIAHICHVIECAEYPSQGFDVTPYLREEDFSMIFWRDVPNGNIDRMLLPDLDYVIYTEPGVGNSVTVYLRLTENSAVNIKTSDQIIIRGIKFGRGGR